MEKMSERKYAYPQFYKKYPPQSNTDVVFMKQVQITGFQQIVRAVKVFFHAFIDIEKK